MTSITWTSGVSGNWNGASNWSGEQVPGTGDDAVVSLPGTYVVTASGITVASLTLDNSAAEVLAAGGFSVTSDLLLAAGTLFIDSNGSVGVAGSLVNAGTIIDNGRLSAHFEDAQGLQRIGGSGSLFANVVLDSFGSVDLAGLGSLAGIRWDGAVTGGTILHMAGRIADSETLTLQSAHLGGSLNSGTKSTLVSNGGVTFSGADGTGKAALLFAGDLLNPNNAPSVIHFNGSQTWDNVDLTARGVRLEVADTLTLGSGLTVFGQQVLHSAALQFTGTGTVLNSGTIDAEGFGVGVVIDVAGFANAGLLEVTPTTPPGSGISSISLNSTTSSNLAGAHIDVVGGVMDVTSAAFSNLGMVTTGTLGTIHFNQGTVSNGVGASMFASAGSLAFSAQSLDNDGTIGSTGGQISFAGATALSNDGTILSAGGSIDIGALLAGTGVVTLQGNGVVEVGSGAAASQTFEFVGSGTLGLMQPAFVAATINGFSFDDTIQLGVAATAISYTDGDLKLQITGGSTIDLAITGSHSLNDFIITTGTSSTLVNLACFAAGTRIRTADGEVAVERLQVGDQVVVTHPAGGGVVLPVVWIGHRRVDCRRHPHPQAVWPIRILAGAFGPNVPCRDLCLSPNHAVFVDGVLVPVKYLLNGTSIAQVRRDTLTYYHVELPRHAVLSAEGLAAESRLPTLDRADYNNGNGPIVLHPDFHSRAWEAEGCAPLVVSGPRLEAIRARLAERAGTRQLQRRVR